MRKVCAFFFFLEKAQLRKLIAVNLFTHGKLRNKVIANKNWFTVYDIDVYNYRRSLNTAMKSYVQA